MKTFKDLKYGDRFFYVENYDIVRYDFIHIDEKYNDYGYFSKYSSSPAVSMYECVYIDKFLSFFISEKSAKKELKCKICVKLYDYREFENNKVEGCEIKSFVEGDTIFIVFSERFSNKLKLEIIKAHVISIKRKEWEDVNFKSCCEYTLIYDSEEPSCFGPGSVYEYETKPLFGYKYLFKTIEDAKSKLYELLHRMLINLDSIIDWPPYNGRSGCSGTHVLDCSVYKGISGYRGYTEKQ